LTPPRRDPLEEARRRLDAAAGALDDLRRFSGAGETPAAPLVPASEGVRREALAFAREELRRLSAELEASRAQGAALLEELGRLRSELAERPTARDLEEARAEGAADSGRRAAELARQVVGLKERVSLLSAEHVRLETLRRKAEAAGSDAEASRRSMEQALRRDLLAAHAELDRAAAESGTREAKAVSEVDALRKRLDQALGRIHRDELERRQALEAVPSLRADFEAASAVIASLRRELSEQRAAALARERALELSAHELERKLHEALSPSLPPAGIGAEGGVEEAAGVEYPAMEFSLEPGWARLFRLVKPPLQAAYGHLRRLSSGPMSTGQRAILRLTGSSLSQAADSLATIELALSDSPASTETAPISPVLDSALAAWDAAFRGRGIALTREGSRQPPDSPHDPEQLRLALHHVLRNALEALPRGATLHVKLGASEAGAVRLEFRDDGPGYPLAWLERRFEPFVSPRQGHAGLGLAAVRRALRRWGGDADASNAASGHGACLILTFAPAPARPTARP